MVKLYFETLTPGMKARLDATFRTRHRQPSFGYARNVFQKLGYSGSVNCLLSDNVKKPDHRTQL